MLTEAHIRRALDGTFTRFRFSADRGAYTVTEEVGRDWVPDYNPPPEHKKPNMRPGEPRKPWAPEHDQMLLELRRSGVSLNACTEILGRGIKQIRLRLRLLEAA